jgi:AcrR family transcriptional regulator
LTDVAQVEAVSVDPRILRTRRDVVDAAAALLLAQGWAAVTHAEVARRAGYSKATIYAHWPTRLDLIRACIGQICGAAEHPQPTGDLRADLVRGLADFADDLSRGHLDRVLGGVLERAGTDPAVEELRQQLWQEGTRSMEAILGSHLPPDAVEPSLALLVGGVLVHVAFHGRPATTAFIEDLIDRVLLCWFACPNTFDRKPSILGHVTVGGRVAWRTTQPVRRIPRCACASCSCSRASPRGCGGGRTAPPRRRQRR